LSTYAGIAGSGVGAVVGAGGAATGNVPLAGAGVLILERSAGLIAQGEGASKLGNFLSAVGGDYSGFGSDPLTSLASKVPFIGHSAESIQAAINKGIEKAAEPLSEKLLGCKVRGR
jgi:hypothetical protein